ncbi:MAG: transmembrane sensor [Cyclobacteriaceae bacterium]|jgi:ferric-dicitrate binding protein FerR (iron transport regulator)
MKLEEEKIFNYLNGFSTEVEKQQIEGWLSLSDSNKKEFDDIKQLHEFSAMDIESYSPDIDQAWSVVSEELFNNNSKRLKIEDENSNSFKFGVFYRIAAVLVLAIGIAYFAIDRDGALSFDLAYQTKSGELRELLLADGTEVSLNENTTLRSSEQFGSDKRVVFLEGEAFFNVAKDKQRPFIIKSATASTRVLGTSFNLKVNSKEAKIDVYSGKVEFGVLSKENNQIILTKGQSAAFKEGVTSGIRTINANADSWKTGQLKFEGTPMAKVVVALERLYDVEIDCDKNIASCTITSIFDNESLKEVLKVIETIAQIKNVKKDGVIHLSGAGC